MLDETLHAASFSPFVPSSLLRSCPGCPLPTRDMTTSPTSAARASIDTDKACPNLRRLFLFLRVQTRFCDGTPGSPSLALGGSKSTGSDRDAVPCRHSHSGCTLSTRSGCAVCRSRERCLMRHGGVGRCRYQRKRLRGVGKCISDRPFD